MGMRRLQERKLTLFTRSCGIMICDNCGDELSHGKHQCDTCGHFTWHDTPPQNDDDGLVALSDVDTTNVDTRLQTGAWDYVWGGPKRPGIVRIQTYMTGGYPGSGKTTLAFQTLAPIVEADTDSRPALYLGNEQEGAELVETAHRLGFHKAAGRILVPKVRGGIEYPLSNRILARNPCCIIQDSLPGNEGTNFIESINILQNLKDVSATYGCPSFIINHVNSEGEMAGLMRFEHVVGGVFMIEPTHGRDKPWRRFRALKNRMGRTASMILEMGDEGLVAHTLNCACRVCEGERAR
jgi:predicted ATP-dependent serine protease